MTNLELRQHAVRCAAAHSAAHQQVDPQDAWLMWSALHDVDGPGARLLFELAYAEYLRESSWKRLMTSLLGQPLTDRLSHYLGASDDVPLR